MIVMQKKSDKIWPQPTGSTLGCCFHFKSFYLIINFVNQDMVNSAGILFML